MAASPAWSLQPRLPPALALRLLSLAMSLLWLRPPRTSVLQPCCPCGRCCPCYSCCSRCRCCRGPLVAMAAQPVAQPADPILSTSSPVADSPAELSAAKVAERLANVARFRRALEDADAAAASHTDFAPGRVREAIGRAQVRRTRVVDFWLGPSFPKCELRSCADRDDPSSADAAD